VGRKPNNGAEFSDTENRGADRARVPEGWIKPKHGHGLLKPWAPGNSGRPGGVITRYSETLQIARANSAEAMQTLVERLKDPDGRIAVVAANSILERAWGKVREQKPEEQKQHRIDLSKLTGPELALLLQLAQSGRLQNAEEDAPPPVIDAEKV
jgi:hypothetical protein